jgi:Flp pilus assembly protein TadB
MDRSPFRPRITRIQPQSSGFFGRLVAVVVGAGLLVLGLMFSVVLIVAAAIAGLVIWGWFWWKTRALRRQMRERMDMPFGNVEPVQPEGRIIEGEVIRDPDEVPPLR